MGKPFLVRKFLRHRALPAGYEPFANSTGRVACPFGDTGAAGSSLSAITLGGPYKA
ncbi:MAG: hypothetical protein L0Y72_32135 [Gemmataceae bacterium]|nr:hypothetical protein [Gemmataceae bacterium]MCI0743705.1 hypothetical protein [Gemmataceae bacterium]